nr:transposase [Desulfobulbaceae bacterium]
MMHYRRACIQGGTYFFTLVTDKRRKILCEPENIAFLRAAFQYVLERHPFVIDAAVILPDHIHAIWTLPDNDRDFSKRWRLIKSYFTRHCDTHYKNTPSPSRLKKNEQAVWQRRFWEHMIRDEKDLSTHVEYIHYNPVKHGLVKSPVDWPHSSFHRFVANGLFGTNWGAGQGMVFADNIGHE